MTLGSVNSIQPSTRIFFRHNLLSGLWRFKASVRLVRVGAEEDL